MPEIEKRAYHAQNKYMFFYFNLFNNNSIIIL